jgi:hypothetical protein
MFHFLEAQTVQQRMVEIEHLLEYWFGSRKAEYGEPAERLNRYPLPVPLRRFYVLAGLWPPPPETADAAEFIYSGAASHHLQPLDYVKQRPDGRLEFFMEYQGDWVGLTLPSENDPPVWIEGRFADKISGEPGA